VLKANASAMGIGTALTVLKSDAPTTAHREASVTREYAIVLLVLRAKTVQKIRA